MRDGCREARLSRLPVFRKLPVRLLLIDRQWSMCFTKKGPID